MRLLLFAFAAILVAGCTSTETETLIKTLQNTTKEGKVLYGHQDDLMYGHDWNSNDGVPGFERSDVKSVCGKYPAVLGLELGGIEMQQERSLDGVDFKLLAQAAVKHHERGGIVTLSWHPRNIVTGDSAWDVSDTTVVASILPGGAKHEEFISWLSRVCDEIELMRDKKGRIIPIIWRPWHEHTGGWFWWGLNLCSDDEYIALWKMTYEYMDGVRGLHNLVWAISPDANNSFDKWADRYPGNDYVDIIGMDMYHFGWDEYGQPSSDFFIKRMRESLQELCNFAAQHGGKPVAITETGCEGLKADKFWTEVLAPAIEGFPVAYALTWRNSSDASNKATHFYAPFPGSPLEEDFLQWIASGKVGMLD